MTTTVLRYQCDLCGSLSRLEGVAEWCEQMCAEAAAQGIAARSGETAKQGSTEGKSPVATPCANNPSEAV